MPDLSPTVDGYIGRFNQSSWTNARDGTSGNASGLTVGQNTLALRADRTSARGGGTAFHVYRTFMEFDTSDVKLKPSAATLKVYGYINSTADLLVVQANFSDGSLSTADFDSIVNWGAGNRSINVIRYTASEITSWSTSAYNELELSETALEHMVENDLIKMCFIEYDHDLTDNSPTGLNRSGMYFSEASLASRRPLISYTPLLNSFNGVSSSNIASINGVASGNISKINGV